MHMTINLNGDCEVFYNNIPEVQILDELNLKPGLNDNEHLKNEGEILKYFQKQGYTHITEKGFNSTVVDINYRLQAIKVLTS